MDYEVTYSKRRSVTVKVKDCRILVLAPIGFSGAEIDKLLIKHRAWINKRLNEQKIKSTVFDSLTEEDIKKIKKSARAYLTERTEYYAGIMSAEYSKIRITGAKTRFGSCTSCGNISYSYRLMLYPEAAREYVVVHELAHTFEMNHSKKFYAIIEKVLPDYKQRKKLLQAPVGINTQAYEK